LKMETLRFGGFEVGAACDGLSRVVADYTSTSF